MSASPYIGITDRLDTLERELDHEAPGSGPNWAMNRRMMLRKLLQAVEAQGWHKGYSDGLRDAGDSRFTEERWARKQEKPDG